MDRFLMLLRMYNNLMPYPTYTTFQETTVLNKMSNVDPTSTYDSIEALVTFEVILDYYNYRPKSTGEALIDNACLKDGKRELVDLGL